MGHEFVVRAWVDISDEGKESHYCWIIEYEGDNYKTAMNTAKACKANGVGCVRIEWR